MPKKSDEEPIGLELPKIFDDWPEAYQPTRPSVNRLVFPSPLAEYPGTVTTPVFLDAIDFTYWWELAKEDQPEDDERHWSFWLYETRHHIIKDWKLENIETAMLEKSGAKLPDMRIAVWISSVTQPVIKMATSLPNWQGPSSGI